MTKIKTGEDLEAWMQSTPYYRMIIESQYSVAALAEATGVSRQTVYNYLYEGRKIPASFEAKVLAINQSKPPLSGIEKQRLI